jgi:hypothetical protein
MGGRGPLKPVKSGKPLPPPIPKSTNEIEMESTPEVDIEAAKSSSPSKNYSKIPMETPHDGSSMEKRQTISADRAVKVSDVVKGKFEGKQQLQFALWAHYMSFGAAAMSIFCGIFAIAWEHPQFYNCKIEGKSIFPGYILNTTTGTCTESFYFDDDGNKLYSCCDSSFVSAIQGSIPIGILYILYGFGLLLYENPDWGFGLWYPTDSFTYERKISITGIIHMMTGIVGLSTYVTCLGGFCIFSTGVVCCIAAKRKEAGDGGREQRAKQRENAKKVEKSDDDQTCCFGMLGALCNPINFLKHIYNTDQIATYFWLGFYVAVNIVLFAYTLHTWEAIVSDLDDGLLQGTFRTNCDGPVCKFNRKVVKYGPLSSFAPWAKSCGNLLNFNCALVMMPVTKMLLTSINNFGIRASSSTSFIQRYFSRPITRYIPLSKNIEFHKLIAIFIFVYAWGHMIFHFLNLTYANETTLAFFRLWSWDGTSYFTGAVITVAMFFIFSAAPERVRHAKFEIFFFNHQWLIVFFVALLFHGPVFFYWAILPFILYCYEKYLESKRGGDPFLVVKVEWIAPVLAVYFRPVFKVASNK